MPNPMPNITVPVDLTNPGQFFACCGLLELADRLWPGAEGWFEDKCFYVAAAGTLGELIDALTSCQLTALDPEDPMESPLIVGLPASKLRLDWWGTAPDSLRTLKVWAGSMRGVRIAGAMRDAIRQMPIDPGFLNAGGVVYATENPKKKVEPYYFDGCRGANATSLDIGFAPDALKMTTSAYPAVEFLTLVSLQRFRPKSTKRSRVFDYWAWSQPAVPLIAAAYVNGSIPSTEARRYRFECGFRTDQRKHKTFLPASLWQEA